MAIPEKNISLDESGIFFIGEARLADASTANKLLSNMTFAENGAFQSELNETAVLIEAFDEPYVALHILSVDKNISIKLNYGFEIPIQLESLTVDEWDRFHGLAKNGIPFVLSTNAQEQLFDLCDEYDDDSITLFGKKLNVPPWFQPLVPVETEKFWTKIYQNEKPGWDMGQPAPALVDMMARLKLSKSRVIVLGCGPGHDAAYFAQQGHVVTAVDISAEALTLAKRNYGHLHNLQFLESDLFALPKDLYGQFDIVFEHTCYCAIPPAKRTDLVTLWRKLLCEQGYVLGVFFAMERRTHPPFGGTEWELRQRLKKYFHFIFWGRWQNSIDRRNGKEVLVYAQKLRP